MDYLLISVAIISYLWTADCSCMFNFARNTNVELQIWPPPEHLKFKPGKNIYLECLLKGSTNLGSNFKWFAPWGEEVLPASGNGESIFSRIRGNGRLALYILNPSENHVGQWNCSSTYGEILKLTTAFQLSFSREITFQMTPELQMIDLLEEFSKINCSAEGVPTPETEWWRNGHMITTGGRYEVVNGGLKIRDFTESDTGLYECRIYIREQGEIAIKNITAEIERAREMMSQDVLSDSPEEKNSSLMAFSEPASTRLSFCDFEAVDICGFFQDKKDDFDWTRLYGETPTIKTGPSSDHTYGTKLGHYMYIESSWPQRWKDKARLISPILSGNSLYCIGFWYHMFGQDMGEINVFKIISNGSEMLLWNASGNQGKQWKRSQIAVQTEPEDSFQVVFEGVVGDSFTSDVALDDIIVSEKPCDDQDLTRS